MYSENNMGAKMEPWGTPQVRGATETERPMPTEKVLLPVKGTFLDAHTLFKMC